jgi:hypothetical protein
MEQGNSSLRERLLARLPQPENVAAYREETAALMAKHERALYWDRVMARTLTFMGAGFFILATSTWGRKLYPDGTIPLEVLALLLFFAGVNELGYRISRAKVDLLKETKQVQLQVLELHALIKKDDDVR